MACVSHLPHVLANLLVAQAAAACSSARTPSACRRSARASATPSRVAGANSAIWTDIYLSNSDALIDGIDEAVRRLATCARRGATRGVPPGTSARAPREALLGAGLTGGPVHELRASVPNRPA